RQPSRRNSAGSTVCGRCARSAGSTVWAWWWTSCPTTWGSPSRPTTRGGGRRCAGGPNRRISRSSSSLPRSTTGLTGRSQSRRWGPERQYFSFGDVDTAVANGAAGKIAIPVLGSPDDGAALVVVGPDHTPGGEAERRFHEHRFPLAPGTEHPAPGTHGDVAREI